MRAFSFQHGRRRLRSFPGSFAATAAAALLCLSLAVSPGAAQFPGRVEGRVVDALSGRPVHGATISLLDGDSFGPAVATSDPAGRFTVVGLGSGLRELRVRRVGYAPARVEVEVTDGRVTRPRVPLEPLPLAVEGVVARAEAPSGGVVLRPSRSEAGTAGDMLGAVPGVVVHRQGEGGRQTLSVRGSADHEVLVLVDGVPLNDPVTGVADLSLLRAASISTLVLLPGARSAAYGPRAQGGVVLVETRGADQGVRARLIGGSLGRVGGELGVGGMLGGRGEWSVSAHRETVDGGFDFRLPPSVGGGEGTRRNADVERTSLAAALELATASGTVDLRLRAEDVGRGLPGRSFTPSPRARQRERRAQMAASWEREDDGVRLRVDGHAAVSRSRVHDPAPPTGLPWDDRTRAWTAGTRVRVASAGSDGSPSVRGGLELRVQGVEADGLDPSAPDRRVDAGLFAAAQAGRRVAPVEVVGRFTGRLDRAVSRGGVVPSHDASVHVTVDEGVPGTVTGHLAWRSAFAPPTLADQHFRAGVGVEPNPDLRAERVPWELEAGLSATGAAGPVRLSTTVTAYRSDVRDMIEWAPDFRFVWSPRNVDVERAGVEIRGDGRVPVGGGSATLSASWSRARATYARDGAEGVQLRYRPRHTAEVTGAWSSRRASVELTARYTGLRHTVPAPVNTLGGFWTAELSADVRVRLGADWELVPALRVERLFDSTDALVFGFPHPGRTASLSLQVAGPGLGS